jgi:hypothetical protein
MTPIGEPTEPFSCVEKIRKFTEALNSRYVDLNGHKTYEHEPDDVVQLWAREQDFLVLAVEMMTAFLFAAYLSAPDVWSLPHSETKRSTDEIVRLHRDELRARMLAMRNNASAILGELESKLRGTHEIPMPQNNDTGNGTPTS